MTLQSAAAESVPAVHLPAPGLGCSSHILRASASGGKAKADHKPASRPKRLSDEGDEDEHTGACPHTGLEGGLGRVMVKQRTEWWARASRAEPPGSVRGRPSARPERRAACPACDGREGRAWRPHTAFLCRWGSSQTRVLSH